MAIQVQHIHDYSIVQVGGYMAFMVSIIDTNLYSLLLSAMEVKNCVYVLFWLLLKF